MTQRSEGKRKSVVVLRESHNFLHGGALPDGELLTASPIFISIREVG